MWPSNPTTGHIPRENHNSKRHIWASLVVQWLRIHLPMQGTFDPWSRKIPHATEQLSLCAKYWPVWERLGATTAEPRLCNKRSHCREKPVITMKSNPQSPQLERAQIQQWRLSAAWNKLNIYVSESHSVMSDSLQPHGLYSPWNWKMELVAAPSSRGSSQPKGQIQVSHIAGGFFTSWATRDAQEYWSG